MKKTATLKKMVLLFAASLMIFSTSLASATGLFSEMNETEYADERLPILDEVADTVSTTQTEGSVTVEISQAYYEGNRVYISYKASSQILEQDGLILEDGSYADIIAGGKVQKEDGSVIGWKECIVPEDELADTQTFFLEYSIPETAEKRKLGVALNRHEYSQFLSGVSTVESYQARAYMYIGKVDLKGIVVLTSPEQAASWLAWQEGADSTGTDVISCWNLYQNGELVSCDLFGESAVNEDDVTFAVMFPFMEDISGLTLVPEYSDAGEKPDEAIALEQMNEE